MAEDIFELQSGNWRSTVISGTAGDTLELVDVDNADNKMRVRLPFTWKRMVQRELNELARTPELRLWRDRDGLLWRVADIGPGTHYFFPLHTRHLLFDSDHAWAGIVECPDTVELGDLTNADLERYRDAISDIGGRRRHYRSPKKMQALPLIDQGI